MTFQSNIICCAVALTFIASQPALANEADTGSLRISARIPPACSLAASPIAVESSENFASTTVFESCNTNRGFQILAAHRPLDPGESAKVSYDGQLSELKASGLSFIQFRGGARHGPVRVNVATGSLAAPLAISFALTPV